MAIWRRGCSIRQVDDDKVLNIGATWRWIELSRQTGIDVELGRQTGIQVELGRRLRINGNRLSVADVIQCGCDGSHLGLDALHSVHDQRVMIQVNDEIDQIQNDGPNA